MRMARWPAELGIAALAVAALGGRVCADPKIEQADRLFAEGKALLASNLLQACAKFDQSLQYNPAAIGTLLNVALCDEKLGRVATAVAKFSEARDRAKEQGLTQHVRAAEEHIAALEPAVPYLEIKLTERLDGTTIVLDDHLVALDALAQIAVDPGERELVVNAPDRLPYRATLVIARADRKTVVVPALARSVVIASSQRRIGQIAAVGGGVAVATGLGLGLYGRQLYRKQFDDGLCTHPDGGALCTPQGQVQTQRARTLGNVGTVVGGVGLAIAGVGAYLWLRAPGPASDKLAIVPQVGAGELGAIAIGRF